MFYIFCFVLESQLVLIGTFLYLLKLHTYDVTTVTDKGLGVTVETVDVLVLSKLKCKAHKSAFRS